MPAANPWKKDAKETPSSPEATNPQSRLKGRSRKKEPEPVPEPVPEPSDEEEADHQAGRIKNLAGYFATQTGEVKVVRKKRLEVADTGEEIIRESEPVERLEGVVRSGDPGEWEKPIELEKGWAKNLASRFLNRADEEDTSFKKKPFVMDLDQNESTIAESEPVVLEGVVRSGDKVKDVMGKRGRIKNIAGRFGTGDSASAGGGAGASTWEEGDDEVGDVGEGYRTDRPSVEAGKARSMAERFKQSAAAQQLESGARNGQTKPQWMIELETAQEHGVFENEPEVRDDVVRADDDQPDVICVQHTRNLRAMWTQFEKDENKSAPPPKRADILIRPKKEPTPEPEPEPEPEPAPKGRGKRFGQSVQNVAVTFTGKDGAKGAGKKEKTPPPTGKGKVAAAVKGKQQAASPPPEPEPPVETKAVGKFGLKSVGVRKY